MSWRRATRVAWVEGGEQEGSDVWVLNAERHMIFGISDVALTIWLASDGADTIDEVVDRLVEAYGWSRAEIAGPVEQFVHLLVQQGFLEEVGV